MLSEVELGPAAVHAVDELEASVLMLPDIGTEEPAGAVKSTATLALTFALPSPLEATLVKLTVVDPKLK